MKADGPAPGTAVDAGQEVPVTHSRDLLEHSWEIVCRCSAALARLAVDRTGMDDTVAAPAVAAVGSAGSADGSTDTVEDWAAEIEQGTHLVALEDCSHSQAKEDMAGRDMPGVLRPCS